jgi:hypothetical protein
MDFVISNIVLVVISLFAVGYLWFVVKTNKRLPVLSEILIIGVYVFVIVYAFFYSQFQTFFGFFGIKNPSMFFVYLGVLLLFFVCFYLYRRVEEQRIEITNLTREIAFVNHKFEKKNKKKK